MLDRAKVHILMVITLLVGLGYGLSGLAQAEQYQERYIFNQDSGQWRSSQEGDIAAEGIIGQVSRLLADNKGRAAEKLIKKHVKANPEAGDWAELMLLYADCRFVMGDYYKAHERYQRVLDQFIGTPEYAQAILREVAVADGFLAGKKRRFWGIFRLGAIDEGLEILTQVEQLGTGYRVAEVALFKKAQYYYRSGQFELAEATYARLANEYRQGKYFCRALNRSAQSALASFPGIFFDDSALIEARHRFLQYQQSCPHQAQQEDIELIVEQIDAKRAEKEFEIAKFYQRVGKEEAAVFYYNYVLSTWPDSLWADRAHSKLLKLGYWDSAEQES